MNQTKNRMQALGLLDRSFKAATDDELATAIEALDDDHREGLDSFVEAATPDGVRTAVKAGRINGDMEAIAAIISDLCLADCIKELGDHADNPSTDQLKAVLPGIVERSRRGGHPHHARGHGGRRGACVGDHPRPAEVRRARRTPEGRRGHDRSADRHVEALTARSRRRSKAKRAEAKAAKKEADRARKAQSAAARNRA